MLSLRPITLAEGRRFVAEHHRHNQPPIRMMYGVGVELEGKLVGVALVGWPRARLLADGVTLEVTRVATDGAKNANSMLYGACARAAKALGWRRLITYTLASESGASLRAAGWKRVAELPDNNEAWRNRPGRGQQDLFGRSPEVQGDKVRWELQLG